MKLPGIVASILMLTGCAEVNHLKVDSDGLYRFEHEPISVRAPDKHCMLDVAVYDSSNSVDFLTGAGYWMASGQYSVQVFTFDQLSTDSTSFSEHAKFLAERFVVNDRVNAFNFVVQDSKAIDVAGRPGYQATAIDAGKATMVATFVLQNSRITVASLVFPIEKQSDPMRRPFPWTCYNRFLESVSETSN